MEAELKDIRKELVQIRMTMELLKNALIVEKDPEGELSDWTKKELAEARATPKLGFTSHEEVKKMILEE